jgi:hypothetical protein
VGVGVRRGATVPEAAALSEDATRETEASGRGVEVSRVEEEEVRVVRREVVLVVEGKVGEAQSEPHTDHGG